MATKKTSRIILAAVALIGVAVFAAVLVTRSGQQVSSSGQAQMSSSNFTRPANAVLIGDMLLTVVSVETLDIKPPQAQRKYVAVELIFQNVGQLTTGNWSMELVDSDGVANDGALGSATEQARLGQVGERFGNLGVNGLKPGAQAQGPVIFTMLADAKPVRLQYSSSGASGTIPLPK